MKPLTSPAVLVKTIPTPPTTAMQVPATARKPPRVRAARRMIRTRFWWFSTHSAPFWMTPAAPSIRSLTTGSSVLPAASATLWSCCWSRSNFSGSVSFMADAISEATAVPCPMASYKLKTLSCSSPVLLYSRSMRSTASSVPNAVAISCFSMASMVSPYFPRSRSRISGRLLIWLLASTNASPSSSPPFAADWMKAAYLVPASEPLMVA